MPNNGEYRLLFIYDCDYDESDKTSNQSFTFSRIEIAHKSGILLTGEMKGEMDYIVYESLFNRDLTTTEAFKKGFAIAYDYNVKDTKILDIVEDTFVNIISEFKIKEIDVKRDKIRLIEERLNISSKEALRKKKEFAIKLTNQQIKASALLSDYESQKDKIESSFELLFNKNTEEKEQETKEEDKKEINIKEILTTLKRKIIAQDEAINSIVPSIIINQKLAELNKKDLLRTQKTSILVDGPTGVGKTLIVEELAGILELPMIVRGITNYSTVGYKGDDLSSILVELLKSANGDIEKAQRGIVCFDEIDKLGDTELEMRKGIAQELLSWMNGTKILIESEKGKSVSFDTSKLTIVGLGAFSKMREEKKKNKPIGFLAEDNNEEYTTEDFVKIAGMQRELMGRFNCIASLKDLDVNDLKRILTDSELSPLKSFIELASLYGVEVKYDEEFLDEIAERAYEERIGARALQRQINEIRNKHLIDIISKDIECIDLRKSKHVRTLEM